MRRLWLTLLFMLPVAAHAQSNSGWVSGFIPTATQWAASQSAKVDVTGGLLNNPTINNATLNNAILNTPTFTGSATFSGGLSATPISGSTGAFTTLAETGTFTVGPSSADTLWQQSATANVWRFQLGGSTSQFWFLDNAGNRMLSIGSSPELVNTNVQLNLTPSTAVSNGYMYPLREILTLTGAATQSTILNYFYSTDTVAETSTDMEVMRVQQFFGGSSMTGNRNALVVDQTLTATSGNSASNGGTQFSGLQVYTTFAVADNGTALANGSTGGVSWDINTVATANSGATNLSGIVGYEMDLVAKAGSSMLDKFGLDVELLPTDAVQGSRSDAAIVVRGSNTPSGFKNDIQFGAANGNWASCAGCTLINAVNNIYTPYAMPALDGINFSLVTFSDCSFKDAYSCFYGNGSVSLNAGSVLSLSATNGFVALPFTAGVPTGAPTLNTACAIDTTNGYLNCYYGGAWHKVAFSSGAG